MTRGKKLISMLLVLVLLIGGVCVVKLVTPEEEDSTETTGEVVTELVSVDPEMVTSVSWTYQEESLTFSYDGESWTYAEDDKFPLNENYLNTMMNSISSISVSKTIEAPEDLSQYGLEEPVCTVSVTTDETLTFQFGDTASLADAQYFTCGDGNVYLVDTSIASCFYYGLYDLIETETVPEMANITQVSVEGNGQQLQIVNLEGEGLAYSDTYVWFLYSNDDYQTLDTELTDSLISTVTGVYWSSCADYYADDAELESYGLTDPAVVASIQYNNGSSEFALELGNESGDYCYARIKGSNMVYKISKTVRDTLLYTTYNDLIPDEILLIDWAEVTYTDVTLDGETYHIETSVTEATDDDGNTVTETTYLLDGKEVTAAKYQDVLDTMASTGYSGSVTTEETPMISFTFGRDTEQYPEVVLEFIRYNSSDCLVRLNGEISLLTSREDVVSLIDAFNAMLAAEAE